MRRQGVRNRNLKISIGPISAQIQRIPHPAVDYGGRDVTSAADAVSMALPLADARRGRGQGLMGVHGGMGDGTMAMGPTDLRR